jgi:hypothetical protein
LLFVPNGTTLKCVARVAGMLYFKDPGAALIK